MTTSHSTDQVAGVDRRAMLVTLAAAGAALTGGTALAQEDHEHHMAHEMAHEMHDHGAAPAHAALISAALECIKSGEICANHCIGLLGQGDTSLKECLRLVSSMLPACAALVRLAALDATRLKEFAKVCGDICADCEAECKKHQDHHAECKACAQSCAACVKECEHLA